MKNLAITLPLVVACGTVASNTTPDTCPRNGVVPADMRDVERAGEGLVTTTFGEYDTATNTRSAPLWSRAATVQGILKQVWSRSNFKTCATDGDCRLADGYVCQLFLTTSPKGFGPSDKACAFPCTRDADCQSPLKCNIASAKCTP